MIRLFKDKPISSIAFILVLVGLSFFLIDEITPDAIPLDSIPRIVDINSNDALDVLTNSSGEYPYIFLFSRETCPSCVKAYPVISEVFNDLPIEFAIFYFDTDKNRNTENFEKVLEMFNVETVPAITVVLGDEVLAKIDDLDILMNAEKLNEVIKGVYP